MIIAAGRQIKAVSEAKANLHLDSRCFPLSSGVTQTMSWSTAHSTEWPHVCGDPPSLSVVFMVRKQMLFSGLLKYKPAVSQCSCWLSQCWAPSSEPLPQHYPCNVMQLSECLSVQYLKAFVTCSFLSLFSGPGPPWQAITKHLPSSTN